MAPNADDDKGNVILTAAIVCTVLSTLSFLGRIWGRSLSAMKLGWDDLLMTFAMIGCWSITAINILGLHFGFGRHTMFLPPSDIKNYIITLFVFFVLQVITTTFIKITILILYQRTFSTRRFQNAVWIVGAIVIANSIGVFVSVCCYCTPIAHFWDPLRVPGHCINEVFATTMFSLTLMITDLIIYVMPMPIIWKLKMTTRRRIEITLVFVIGLFVCLTRIVQLVDTIRLDLKDPTWSNVDVAIWNMVESHIGAVAANIPLMGPLIALVGRRLHLSATIPSSRHGESHKQGGSEYALGSLGILEHRFKRMDYDGSGDATFMVVASPRVQEGASELDDEMHNMDQLGRKGIRVKTGLEQNYGGLMPARRSLF